MTLVVSNTSPLTSLAAIGHFDLLRDLFGQIHIARGVWDELNQGGLRHPGSREVEDAPWIQRHDVENPALVTILRRDLDRGEAETLALALELKADLVLLDEQEGHHTRNPPRPSSSGCPGHPASSEAAPEDRRGSAAPGRTPPTSRFLSRRSPLQRGSGRGRRRVMIDGRRITAVIH